MCLCSADLDLCDAERLPLLGNVSFVFPMVWRFMPGVDEQVHNSGATNKFPDFFQKGIIFSCL